MLISPQSPKVTFSLSLFVAQHVEETAPPALHPKEHPSSITPQAVRGAVVTRRPILRVDRCNISGGIRPHQPPPHDADLIPYTPRAAPRCPCARHPQKGCGETPATAQAQSGSAWPGVAASRLGRVGPLEALRAGRRPHSVDAHRRHVPCRSQQLARTTMATATRLCRAVGMSSLIRRMTSEEKRG